MLKHAYWMTLLILLLNIRQGWAFCSDTVDPTVNEQLFVTDLETGIVTDSMTGLMWSVCNLGENWSESLQSCTGTATSADWQQSLIQASQSQLGGFEDWRLPNIKELMSIIERQCAEPAANLTLFPTTKSEDYWTSTPVFNVNSANYVWAVQFKEGTNLERDKTRVALSRLVRKVTTTTN